MRWTRRGLIAAAAALPLAGTSTTKAQEQDAPQDAARQATAEAAAGKILRIVPHAPLQSLDPIWTTAYVTRNHGYMIYDTLFALDATMQPQPQMVDTWSVSDDRLKWTFTLRDGLSFHDGAPVTAEDVIASLARWGVRDATGQRLMAAMTEMIAVDARTVEFRMREPFGPVLDSIGKIGSPVPFIMPRRVAETDPFEEITDHTGSGPFRFEGDQWVPGRRAVYSRFEGYVARPEPPSWAAGGKVARVDKVIWAELPGEKAAMNALAAGEVDYVEQPGYERAAILAADPNVTVEINDPVGSIAVARFNHLLAPFDDVAIRRAALMAMNQKTYMTGAIGDAAWWRACYSVYPCGTALASEAGADIMMVGDPADARQALAATAYDGRPVVILQPTDVPLLSALALISAESLTDAGFTVELQPADWATAIARRASREPVELGGWNMFHGCWAGVDILDPLSIAFSGNPRTGWFGWPEDAELERLRNAYARMPATDERRGIAERVQKRLWEIAASGHLGQFFTPVAYRRGVTGLIDSPVQLYWNIDIVD